MHGIPYSLQVVTPPASEPLDLADTKVYLNVDSDGEDALVASMISIARDYVEGQTGRVMLPTQYRMAMDRFPLAHGLGCYAGGPFGAGPLLHDWWSTDKGHRVIRLPRAPLLSVDSLTYTDGNGVTQTLAPSVYAVDAYGLPPRVCLAAAASWPAVQPGPGAVLLTFTAGYSTAAAVPKQALMAMRLLVGHWYTTREAVLNGRFGPSPFAVDAILANLMVPRF